jgi:hypothetical protein
MKWPEDYDAAMAHAERLGLMSDGHATDRCQCSECGRVFSTEPNFDRHLTPGRLADDFDGDWCRSPAGVGLVQAEGGWWTRPEPQDGSQVWEDRSATVPRSLRTVERGLTDRARRSA